MNYLFTLLFAFLLSFGLPISTNAVSIDYGNHEITDYFIEECSVTVKESSWWSFSSEERTITGPCEELKELM